MKQKTFRLLLVLCLLALSGTPANYPKRVVVSVSGEYQIFIPFSLAPYRKYNCSAGYYASLDYTGVAACAYEWAHSRIYQSENIETINMVRSTSTLTMGFYVDDCPVFDYPACLRLAAANPAFWQIWNEPDWGDPLTSDGVSPTQAAQYYRVISDTIKSVNPNARFVVGNILFSSGQWLTDFIAEYQRLYHADVRPSIYAYGVHAYAILGANCGDVYAPTSDACLMQNFSAHLSNYANWVKQHDPTKKLWLTEFNWSPFNEIDQQITARRLTKLCAEIDKYPVIERRFYFIGNTWSGASNVSLFNSNGTPSIIGQAYAKC